MRVKELRWAIVSVSDQNKLDWAASQSAANTSDVYSISSLILLIVALVFLVSWLYYCEKEKSQFLRPARAQNAQNTRAV